MGPDRVLHQDPNASLLLQRLAGLRSKLLDLSNRNRLLAFKHSETSRTHVRIIDELPDVLFRKLAEARKLAFKALPEPQTVPADEGTPEFVHALEAARESDPDYRAAAAPLSSDGKTPGVETEIERALRDRVRMQLGMPPWADERNLSASDLAIKYGYDPSYDLPESAPDGELSERHGDNEIQTLLIPAKMDRKLSGIYDQARSMLQEVGVNTLQVAFGFLEWAEAEHAGRLHQSPLLLMPAQIDRILQPGRWRRYILSTNSPEVEVNETLRIRLDRDFGYRLPDFEADETPESYLRKVAAHIEKQTKWRVRRFVTVGTFGFSKLAMYHDLDPEKWPEDKCIDNHPRAQDLLLGTADDGEDKVYADVYPVDRHEFDTEPVHLVADADASQHSAVIDAVRGKSMVIKGPPGTGKSQTITNIISSLIASGKRVLFVAEKLAALDVVYSRLKSAGLHEFCLEVHSTKVSKKAVLANLKSRLALRDRLAAPQAFETRLAQLRKLRDDLNHTAQTLNDKFGGLGLTINEILWGELRSRMEAGERCVGSVDSIKLASATDVSLLDRSQKRAELTEAFDHLHHIVAAFGAPEAHPWHWIGAARPNPVEQRDAIKQCLAWREAVADLVAVAIRSGEEFGIEAPRTSGDIAELADCPRSLPTPPATEIVQLAAAIRETSLGSQVDDLLATCASQNSDCAGSWLRRETDIDLGERWDAAATDIEGRIGILRARATADQNLNDVAVLVSEFRTILSSVGHLVAHARRVREAAGQDNSSSAQDVMVALKAAALIDRTSDRLLALRSPLLNEPGAPIVIARAREKVGDLLRERETLESLFAMRPVPDIETVSRHACSLRGAGTFGFLSSEVRQAKTYYRGISHRKDKPDNETIVARLTELESHLDKCREFNADERIRTVCGACFDGLETDFDSLQTVLEWMDDVRGSFGRAGVGVAIADLLLGASVDVLKPLRTGASAQDLADAIADIDYLSDEGEDVEQALGRISNEMDALDVAASALLERGFLSDVPLKRISAYASGLAALEPLRELLGRGPGGEHLQLGALTIAADYLRRLEKIEPPAPIVEQMLAADAGQACTRYVEAAARLEESCAAEHIARQAVLDTFSGHSQIGDETTQLADTVSTLEKALAHQTSMGDWIDYGIALDEAKKGDLDDAVAALVNAQATTVQAVAAYDWLVFRSLIGAAYKQYPHLAKINGLSMNGLRGRFQELDSEILTLEQENIAARLAAQRIASGNGVGLKSTFTDLQLIRNELAKRARHIPLRDLFHRAARALQDMKPCFMMSPLSVASYLPQGQIEFDVVVMDEASQLPLEDAIGAILRAEQCIIVGDDMQLPPTTFFQRFGDSSDEDDQDDDDGGLTVESVLHQGFAVFRPARVLNWHYRSRHQSLIALSNKLFYDNHLTVFPSFLEDHPDFGVKLQDVNGIYADGQNPTEVEAVGTFARAFMLDHPGKSLGIVTMNQAQRDLIRDEMDRIFQASADAEAYRQSWEDTLQPFFVKNLENVQGDERDVIVISTVYGPNVDGRVAQNFGPITQDSGHRRLNVLFTRARERLVLITSLTPDRVQGTNPGPSALRAFLEYAKTGRLDAGEVTDREPDSDFEIEVTNRLAAAGYSAVPQVGVAGYYVDIGVRHPEFPDMFLLGVECDGATYHSAKSARDRDRLREEVLLGQGWKLYRIWSTDWFSDPDGETKKLVSFIETCAADRRSIMRQAEETMPPEHLRLEPEEFVEELRSSDGVEGVLGSQQLEPQDALEEHLPCAPARLTCEVGDTVVFHYEDRPEDRLKITLAIGESDPAKGVVSYLSPVGEALNGAAEGEDVEVYLSDVTRTILIEEIIKKAPAADVA